MNETELLHIFARGEDSRHQFKRDAANADSVAAEMAAFANSGGGYLFFGVADDGTVAGLDGAAVRRLNQLFGPSMCDRRCIRRRRMCRRIRALSWWSKYRMAWPSLTSTNRGASGSSRGRTSGM